MHLHKVRLASGDTPSHRQKLLDAPLDEEENADTAAALSRVQRALAGSLMPTHRVYRWFQPGREDLTCSTHTTPKLLMKHKTKTSPSPPGQ